jgi:predicted DNA-binding transcriptional regulator AlpA
MLDVQKCKAQRVSASTLAFWTGVSRTTAWRWLNKIAQPSPSSCAELRRLGFWKVD